MSEAITGDRRSGVHADGLWHVYFGHQGNRRTYCGIQRKPRLSMTKRRALSLSAREALKVCPACREAAL